MAGERIWAPMRSPDYRRLWFGQAVSVVGDKIDQIALGVLVYELTGSGLQVGIMLAISMLPTAVFGMVAGAYVDRWDRRRTMIAADLLRAGLVVAVPFAAEVGLWLVYVIALAVATVSLFFEPAKLSLMPELVGSDQLMAANSLDSATVSVAELLGLAFAGGLVASIGYRVAFFADGITYLLSAVFVAAIAYREQGGRSKGSGWGEALAAAGEGLRYVRSHDMLRDLLVVYAVAAAGVSAAITFVYVLALDRFAAGARGLAGLDAAITIGLLVGSVAVGRFAMRGASRRLLIGLTAFAAIFATSAFAPTILWTAGIFAAAGVANMFVYVPAAAIVQTESAPEMRGRALAAKNVLARALSVLGYIGAGLLTERIGISPAILVVAAAIALAALLGWSRPRLRAA